MRNTKRNPKLKPTKINRILVPFDFSEHASNALRHSIFLAKCFMAEIELLHVVTPIYITPDSTGLLPRNDTYYNRLLKKSLYNLKNIAKAVSSKEGIKISCKTSLNVIHREIINYAKKRKVSIIVMGTHGTSGIIEFFAGSNASRVVNAAPCPVITVQNRKFLNGYKKIILPIRAEINSRQKVNLVATIAKTMMSKIIITGYLGSSYKSEKIKVNNYVKQVENFLRKESISFSSTIIKHTNFTKAIINHANKNKADLIAIMTKHDFSLNQILNGSYAQQFVNHSKIPILSVPNSLKFNYSYTKPWLGEII